jgi:hypothetical protein
VNVCVDCCMPNVAIVNVFLACLGYANVHASKDMMRSVSPFSQLTTATAYPVGDKD